MEHSLNILLAEDRLTNQKAMAKYLKYFGHTVTLANNGVEAVNNYQANKFDVVLLDVEMPELNGIEASEKIRAIEAQENASNTPIIILTAYQIHELKVDLKQKKIDGWLLKPLNLQKMYQLIEQANQN